MNILGFAGHEVSVATTHLCLYSMKTATNKEQMNEYSCVPIMSRCVYLQSRQPAQGQQFCDLCSRMLSGLPPLIPGDKPGKQTNISGL